MTANKVPGVRAALCGDAETARGAIALLEPPPGE
ncbi:MAG: RpiB/LacA/LacB family sugar-phosphate isomerase [Chloroflexota bacterium]